MPKSRFILLSLILILLRQLGFNEGHAAEKTRFVVAHWHVPMEYSQGESVDDRTQNDIRAALEAGLDGFAFNVYSQAQAKHVLNLYSQAADAIHADNFKMFLSIDMSRDCPAAEIVGALSEYGGHPRYLKIDGKPILSTYGGGKKGNAWWVDNVVRPLKVAGHPVVFIPQFDRANPNADAPSTANWTNVLREFPAADGLFSFLLPGSTPFRARELSQVHHMWSSTEGEENLGAALRRRGKLFIAPYSPYYWAVCHSVRQYLEFQGGRGMERAWTSIITRQKPDGVEIVTWNDYTESTFVQPTNRPLTQAEGIPSFSHVGYYELLKYYINWYKTDVKPEITKDAVFYFYRTSPVRAALALRTDTACALGPVEAKNLWGKVDDVIYVTTALVSPGEIKVESGGKVKRYPVGAGLVTTDVPFQPGRQVIEIVRDGKILASSHGVEIVAKPKVCNMNVHSGYSISGGGTGETWKPSDAWNQGFIADWFKPGQKK